MLRRPTPWQRGRRTRTSRGRFSTLVQASLVVAALSLAVLVTFVPTAVGSATALPVISYTIDGITGTNDWYRGSAGGNYVVLHWSVTGADNTDCTFAVKIDGPNPGTTRTCSASNSAGPITATTKVIKIDADPPVSLSAAANRPTDYNGWYNHPVAIAWRGADATSGIAGCTAQTYSGPDASAANVSGGCTDNAGNSATTSFGLNYDATPPMLTALSVQSREGAEVLQWKSSSPVDVGVITRAARGSRSKQLVFKGAAATFTDKKIRAGLEYRYFAQTYDQAGNASKTLSILALPKVVTLRKVGYTPQTTGNPVLQWTKVRGAAYYHVQLFRRGKRILAAWPLDRKLGLRTTWRWSGRRYRLSPGAYRWYVWAGFGPRAKARYKLLGNAIFIVSRSRRPAG
jgi:hypothetical protein